MTSLSITSEAYIKIILHAARYASQPVGGFLIGSQGTISDIGSWNMKRFLLDLMFLLVPIYHNHPLAPLLEIAGAATESQKLEIIGFYFANEYLDEDAIPLYITKIEKTIFDRRGSAVLLQVKNKSIDDNSTVCLLVRIQILYVGSSSLGFRRQN